jgi:hypothetical protein
MPLGRTRLTTRRKAHKNWVCLSTPINFPFLVFFPNRVCVCVCVCEFQLVWTSGWKLPRSTILSYASALFKDTASFLPYTRISIQKWSITAADSAQGPNLLVAISAWPTTTKWRTRIDHQNAVGTVQQTTNNNEVRMGCSSAIVLNLFCG